MVSFKGPFSRIPISFVLMTLLWNAGCIPSRAQIQTEIEGIPFRYPDSSKIRSVEYADGHGFLALDEEGKTLFAIFPFDNGPDGPSEGLFRITEDGKLGYADEMGNVVVEPQFDAALPFSGGLAAVCSGCIETAVGEHGIWEGGKWGFIDRSGRTVIPPRFDRILRPFSNGTADVEYGGLSIRIDEEGEQAMSQEVIQSEWIDLLFSSIRLAAELFFDNAVHVEMSERRNEGYVFSAKQGSGFLRIQVSNSQDQVLLAYDVIPPQDFSIRGELDLAGGLALTRELVTVTDYAAVYAQVNPYGYTGQLKETIELFHRVVRRILEEERHNQLQDEELDLPQDVRIISSKVYSHYADLQIALPGTAMPDDSAWRTVGKGKLLYLQLVPDAGEVKKRWIKTIDSREDPYYTSVEEDLLKVFSEALSEAHRFPASRNEISERAKTRIRGLFSAANSYVNFLYDKYEHRLESWLLLEDVTPRHPIEEEIFGDYQPKETPDAIIDFMPSLRDKVDRLPSAVLENWVPLVELLEFFTGNARNTPGHWEDGNMVLGAQPREYRPSVDELMASEVGDRLAKIIDDHRKEDLIDFFGSEHLNPIDLEYVHFDFIHVDVMGSGRFFYVQSFGTVKLSLEMKV